MYRTLKYLLLAGAAVLPAAWAHAQSAVKITQEKINAGLGYDPDKLPALEARNSMLKNAYKAVFLRQGDDPSPGPAPQWRVKAEAELKRRGNEAVPLLLELFDENPEGMFRFKLMSGIHRYPEVDITPILEHVRRFAKSRWAHMSDQERQAVAWFLSWHGTKEDIETLESFGNNHAQVLHLKKRLGSDGEKK